MATDKPRAVCPKCDVEMNRHASKLTHPTNTQEATEADPILGGLLEDALFCPNCGKNYSYRVSA